MKVSSDSFGDHQRIPGEYAFAVPDPATRMALSKNRNPHLAWSDLPAGTRSLAVICHDRDVPSKLDDFNQEGRVISASLPRVDFYHWTLVDLDPNGGPIRAGEFSDGITPHGKPGPAAPRGARQGINGYGPFFAGDKDMAGDYYGYDGPCPPWNDELPHRYVFTVYALDILRCPLEGKFTAEDVLKAIQGHVLGQAAVTGVYSMNPDVKI